MADELTLTASFAYSKSSTSLSLVVNGLQVDVSGTAALHARQTVGTSEEALNLGDVTAVGYLIVVNRDDTNFVEIRPGTGVADLIKIGAGEVALFRLATTATAPYVIADTASCQIEYILLSA